MVIVNCNGQSFFMDGYLKENLDTAKKIVKKDWDMIFLYDGFEGSGKSVKAMQDAFYFDPTLSFERMCFNPRQFTKAVTNAKPIQAVVYDEAYTGLSSRAAMSLINRTLVKMLAEIRQKNLFVAIVMPTFFDLDKYAAIWRSRALIHVYTLGSFQRGFFNFYNMQKKKELYVLGKKFYSYSRPAPNFKGRFTNYYPLNEEEYREIKKKSLIKQQATEDEIIVKQMAQHQMFENVFNVEGITHKKKAELIGISEATYWNWVRKYNETGSLG